MTKSEFWKQEAVKAEGAIQNLINLQQGYEDWKANLPENLTYSVTGDKLEEICGLDLTSALSEVQEAINVEPPKGFGRD